MINLGKIKAHFDRQRNYLSFINFGILAYLFVDKIGLHWWFLLIIPIWAIFIYVDIKWIMKQEFDYLHRKSPAIQELLHK